MGSSVWERAFATIGTGVTARPVVSIVISILIAIGLSTGNLMLETENRPQKLWIPSTAPSLKQKDYVESMYPSSARFNAFLATCKENEPDCNLLEAKYIQQLDEVLQGLKDIRVDSERVKNKAYLNYAGIADDVWASMNGTWSYEGSLDPSSKKKCFAPGPLCLGSSPVGVFRDERPTLDTLDDAAALQAFRTYDSLEVFCPLSLARPDSPCVNASVYNNAAAVGDCVQTAPTPAQRQACELSARNYCAAICPAYGPALSSLFPCLDPACKRTQWWNVQLLDMTNPNPSVAAFEPPLDQLASSGGEGVMRDSFGKVVSAKALRATLFLSYSPIFYKGSEFDPIALEWENAALCRLGISAASKDEQFTADVCTEDPVLKLTPFFARSIGDEFGAEIRGDIAFVAIPYLLVPLYLVIMISRRDHVHSMVAMSMVSCLVVLLSYFVCTGVGGLLGIFSTNLTSTLPLLLLGLGVDDAFVIVGEYERFYEQHPKSSPRERVVAAAKYGGVSILITSVTDGLAFLIGSMTVLPALSYFCVMAGVGVLVCFILQLTLFLPALYLNALRSDRNLFDCCCCFKAKETHEFSQPRGCCFCCKCPLNSLERACGKVGMGISAGVPRVLVLLFFAATMALGVYGMLAIETNFEFEWFLPEDSYSKEFFALNKEYFGGGVKFDVYTRDVDYYASQRDMYGLQTFLASSPIIDHDEGVGDWHAAFVEHIKLNEPSLLNGDAHFTSKTRYYEEILKFLQGASGWGAGANLRGNVKWMDPLCDTLPARLGTGCDYERGIKASRISATLTLESTTGGVKRYETLVALREGLASAAPGMSGDKTAFPYTSTFSNWEEVGVIGHELMQNLLITGSVVVVIIVLMIPHPRIAIFVVASIVLSIVNLVGFMHWWGLTINGVSTIYILLSCGLAVDYSAHVAHMFVISEGTSQERVGAALKRIGPSVFNGIVSTFIAVISLNMTKTYVFQVFAKALALTVVFGGAHGLVLLPALLSVFGGGRPKTEERGKDSLGSIMMVGPKIQWSDLEALAPREDDVWSTLLGGGPSGASNTDSGETNLVRVKYTMRLVESRRNVPALKTWLTCASEQFRELGLGGRMLMAPNLLIFTHELEGPAEVLDKVLASEQEDTQLTGYTFVSRESVPARKYRNWGMVRDTEAAADCSTNINTDPSQGNGSNGSNSNSKGGSKGSKSNSKALDVAEATGINDVPTGV